MLQNILYVVSFLALSVVSQFGGGRGGSCSVDCPAPNTLSYVKQLTTSSSARPIFTSNGCGTDSIRISAPPELIPCCSVHDACYSICGISRSFCDTEFGKCLKSRCNRGDGDCEGQANMLSQGVVMFGCTAFLDAQKSVCTCEDKRAWRESMKDLFLNVLYPSREEKSLAEVEALLTRLDKAKDPMKIVYLILEKRNATLISHDAKGREDL